MELTRDKIVELANRKASFKEVTSVITIYCKEHNKEESDIKDFINVIQAQPFIMGDCYSTALKYYMNKFNVISIQNQQGETIKYY
jgi:hypothetical protein